MTRRLLLSRSREARAAIYLELASEKAQAERVAVAWRRRDAVLAIGAARGEEGRRLDTERDPRAYEAFQPVEALREGTVRVAALEGGWRPPQIRATTDAWLLLPEGRGPGAPRLFVQDVDEESFAELQMFLRALRPHWIERRRLRRRASCDHLTGVYNFRHLRRYLSYLCRSAAWRGESFSILMLDLDHLREYNSRFGHLMGSRVLATVGHTLHKALRQRDFVAKYGGDEFIVILRGAGKTGAVDVALRLKDLISHQTFFGVPKGHITCSFGVATFGEDGDTYESLVGAANRAIFSAKDMGRNRVVVAGIESR